MLRVILGAHEDGGEVVCQGDGRRWGEGNGCGGGKSQMAWDIENLPSPNSHVSATSVGLHREIFTIAPATTAKTGSVFDVGVACVTL